MSDVKYRARVNGPPYGTIAWDEHLEAWEAYYRFYPQQSAKTIADRGGFGIEELVQQLGRMPTTWEPSRATEAWWRRWRRDG